MLSFLATFSIINVAYSTNYLLAIIFCLIVTLLFNYSANLFIKSQNSESGILVILCITILSLSFAQSLGLDAPVWLFGLIIIFQVLFLVPKRNQRIVLIILNVVAGMFTAYIQGQPMANVLSRGAVLVLFSIYGHSTVQSLIQSAFYLKQEIDHKIKLNAKLLETRVFQRRVLDSTNYAIIAVNEDGIIIEFNKGAEQMLEYSAEEILGKSTPMLFHDFNEVKKNTEELNQKYHIKLDPSFETLVFKSRIGVTNNSEWTFITKSKQRINVWLTINTIKDDDGRIKGFMGIAQNITNKKTQEENQQTAEAIIANSPSIVLRWKSNKDREILYISANVSRVLGYTSVELTSANIAYNDLIFEDDRVGIQKVFSDTTTSPKNEVSIEYRIKHKNNTWIWVEERTSIKRDSNGIVTSFEGVITDISARKKAEEQLQESEVRYELAVKSTAAGVWEWVNIADGIVWWSPKYYELLGYDDQEVKSTYEEFLASLHPDDTPRFEETLKLHAENNEPFMIEYRLRKKDGSYRWFLASGQTNRDENGKPVKMVGSIIDIHYKKTNEELLTAREENFRTFIEAAKDVFFQTDPDGFFSYSNKAGLDLLGLTLEELKKHRYIEFIRDDYKEMVVNFYNNQRTNNIKLTYLEIPVISIKNETAWLGQNTQLIYKDGKYTGTHVVARDITEIKQVQLDKDKAELMLKKQLSTQTAVLESTSDSIFALDNNLCYVAFNTAHAKLVKQIYDIDISVGSTLINNSRVNHDTENEIKYLTKALNGESFTREESYRNDDNIIYVQITYNPIKNDDGTIGGVAVFSQDITQKKHDETTLLQAKDEALKAARVKSDFLSNMSHEIRTPMNAIIGITDLLMERLKDTLNIEYLQSIKSSADNLLYIINDILDLSKIESGKITFELVPFNPLKQLAEIKKSFEHQAKEKNIELSIQNNPKIPEHIMGDPFRLNQILINLVGNAIKFTPYGKVEVSVDIKDESENFCILTYCIQDTGIGISKNKFNSIFDSFNQAYTDTSRKFGGTGLGLAITKNLVELQGGEIWLESEEGKGSSFCFEIKFEKTNKQSAIIPAPKIPQTFNSTIVNRSLDGARILLVEDNSMNQFLANQILKKWNAAVMFAETGKEAITIMENNTFDIILMDLQMPEMNGYDATTAIRNGEHGKCKSEVPIIALTADAFEETKMRVLQTGMNDFITKPFKQDELFAKIVKHLPF
jgi:PAS domain S-box-containing protein